MLSLHRALAILLLVPLALARTPNAQETESSTPPASEPLQEQEAEQPLPLPATVDEAIAFENADLREGLQAREKDELRALLAQWLGFLGAQQARLEEALGAPEGSEQRQAASSLGSDRDTLIGQIEVIIEIAANQDVDVEDARRRIARIRQQEALELDLVSTVPADQTMAQDLDLEILRAQLRPLTKDQVEGQLKEWMDLLQKKCLAVRRVEVAALKSEDTAEIEKFNERAVALRTERGRLIERVRVVVTALEKKGGEVKEARAYLSSVVVAPPVTGWRAAKTTALAWITNPDGGIALGKRVGLVLAILVAFWMLSRALSKIVARALRSMKRTSELLREFLIGSVRKLTIVLGILISLSQLGIDMGPLLAAIGAAGLVIGFALQGTLSNFASGLMIMVYRPFDVGDVINCAGTNGKVEGMSLVTTKIKTFDNQTIYVPNNMIWGDVITNVTANPTRRVDMVFGIGYDDDMEKAKAILHKVVKDHPLVLADPEPIVEVSALGDSSVNFIVRPWVKTEDYWKVYWNVTQLVKEHFDREGVSIPFPQRDVHVHHIGTTPNGEGGKTLTPARSDADKAPEAAKAK